jgi:hypothetical protein
MAALEAFVSAYLSKMGYKYHLLMDSHDPRKIDVAILNRYPAKWVRTHKDERDANNTAWISLGLIYHHGLTKDSEYDGTIVHPVNKEIIGEYHDFWKSSNVGIVINYSIRKTD